jgi:benzylsuccinate CoA-transferase BbsF subunit
MAAGLALEGFRVLDLTSAWAGPMCTMLLADMGADVVKVETQARPDITRRLGPFAEGEVDLERSGYFATLCRGKRSLGLNLGTPEGLALLRRLVPLVDVVVENFSPRVMPKLGLTYEALRFLKGDLIMLSMSGYGATGPDRDYVAYGQTLEAFTGYDRLIGYPDSPPMAVGMPISDQLGGLFGALAVVAALRHRARTGQGQFLDLSECETLASVMALPLMELFLNGHVRLPQGNRDDLMAPHNCYRCAGEDEWATIAVGSEHEWQALCAATGHPEWSADHRFATAQLRRKNRDALDALVGAWAARRSASEITRLLQAAGVAASPTASADTLIDDPHLTERGFFTTIPHPVVGDRLVVGPFAQAEPPIAAVRAGAPLLGEHTPEVLVDLLGLPVPEVERLEREGIAR